MNVMSVKESGELEVREWGRKGRNIITRIDERRQEETQDQDEVCVGGAWACTKDTATLGAQGILVRNLGCKL